MTLNYQGQEIDISGGAESKILDDIKKEWIHSPANYSKAKIKNIDGIMLSVIAPEDLIGYKKLLSGEHQKHDIQAVQDYLNTL